MAEEIGKIIAKEFGSAVIHTGVSIAGNGIASLIGGGGSKNNSDNRSPTTIIVNCNNCEAKNAAAKEVPDPHFKTVNLDFVKHGTKSVLRRNVQMLFWDRDCFRNDKVIISQMAHEALEQTGLKEVYKWCQVVQRKKYNGSIECVDTNVHYTIDDGAFYTVMLLLREEPFIVKTDFVDKETGKILRRNVEVKFEDEEFYKGVSVEKMAPKALEQSGLETEGYYRRKVEQRKNLSNGNTEWVKVKTYYPIEHGAFYKLLMLLRKEVVVNMDMVEEGTGKVLRHNMEMELYNIILRYTFYGERFGVEVPVSQIAKDALEQSGLKDEGYDWCQIAQRNELPNGRIEFVESAFPHDDWAFVAKIADGAFYKVVVRKPKKVVVKVFIVDRWTDKVLRQDVEIELLVTNEFLSSFSTNLSDKALEQTGLKTEGYKYRIVQQRKKMANGTDEYKHLFGFNKDPIEDGALYKVFVSKPE